MTRTGVDSAYGPTLSQARTIQAMGYDFWGFYISGSACYHTWTDAEISVLRTVGFAPLPIVVPAQDLHENAAAVAKVAMDRCVSLGIYGAINVDFEYSADRNRLSSWMTTFDDTTAGYTVAARPRSVTSGYDGPHVALPAGIARWEPLPGKWVPGNALGARTAVQWSQTILAGVGVDLNVASDDFPLGSWAPQIQEDTMSTGQIVRTSPTRIDELVIGLGQRIFQATAPTMGELLGVGYVPVGTPANTAKSLSATPDGAGGLILWVHGTNDLPYVATMSPTGVWSGFTPRKGQLWSGIAGTVGEPGKPGEPGAPGEPYDDSWRTKVGEAIIPKPPVVP